MIERQLAVDTRKIEFRKVSLYFRMVSCILGGPYGTRDGVPWDPRLITVDTVAYKLRCHELKQTSTLIAPQYVLAGWVE